MISAPLQVRTLNGPVSRLVDRHCRVYPPNAGQGARERVHYRMGVIGVCLDGRVRYQAHGQRSGARAMQHHGHRSTTSMGLASYCKRVMTQRLASANCQNQSASGACLVGAACRTAQHSQANGVVPPCHRETLQGRCVSSIYTARGSRVISFSVPRLARWRVVAHAVQELHAGLVPRRAALGLAALALLQPQIEAFAAADVAVRALQRLLPATKKWPHQTWGMCLHDHVNQ